MIRRKKILFCTIEDIWFEKDMFLKGTYPLTSLHTNLVLESGQYDFCLTAYTYVIDISVSKEQIIKKFDYKSARYPINKGTRDGVQVRKVQTEDEMERYFEFQKQFCHEKKIPLCGRDELNEMDCYYALSSDGEYLGGCAFFTSRQEQLARYKYGATLHKQNANEMILWQAICDYHGQGYHWFDMGGVTPTDDKESYYYSHCQFKKKFGGELVESYTYFKVRGVYKVFYFIFQFFLRIFFGGDVNGFTNFLSRIHAVR